RAPSALTRAPIRPDLQAERDAQAKADHDIETSRVAAMSPSEKAALEWELRRRTRSEKLYAGKLSPAEKAEVLRELKSVLARQGEAENAGARKDMPIESKLAEFGIAAPKFANAESAGRFDEDAMGQVLDAALLDGIAADVVRDGWADYQKIAEHRDGP